MAKREHYSDSQLLDRWLDIRDASFDHLYKAIVETKNPTYKGTYCARDTYKAAIEEILRLKSDGVATVSESGVRKLELAWVYKVPGVPELPKEPKPGE